MTEKEISEERILEAAHAVFQRSGMAGARTQEIADEAGVNKALIHYYFGTKERLAQAVFRRAAERILPRLYGILTTDQSIEEKVRGVIEAEFDFLGEHRYLPGYVVSEVNYHPELVLEVFRERGGPPLDSLGAQLDAAAAAGTIRPIGPQQFMVSLMSLIFFPFVARPLLSVLLEMPGAQYDDFLKERRATLADFFLAGLRP